MLSVDAAIRPVSVSTPLQHSLSLKLIPRLRKAVAYKNSMIKEGLQQAWSKFSVSADNDDAVKCALDLVVQREAQLIVDTEAGHHVRVATST